MLLLSSILFIFISSPNMLTTSFLIRAEFNCNSLLIVALLANDIAMLTKTKVALIRVFMMVPLSDVKVYLLSLSLAPLLTW